MNDLIVIKDLSKLASGDVEGARAHPPMRCPKCGKNNAQVMDGYIKQEIRLYFNCPDCGVQSCIVKKLTSSMWDEINLAGMTHVQRKFFYEAWIELNKPEPSEPEVVVLDCKDKKLLEDK